MVVTGGVFTPKATCPDPCTTTAMLATFFPGSRWEHFGDRGDHQRVGISVRRGCRRPLGQPLSAARWGHRQHHRRLDGTDGGGLDPPHPSSARGISLAALSAREGAERAEAADQAGKLLGPNDAVELGAPALLRLTDGAAAVIHSGDISERGGNDPRYRPQGSAPACARARQRRCRTGRERRYIYRPLQAAGGGRRRCGIGRQGRRRARCQLPADRRRDRALRFRSLPLERAA